MPDPTEDDVTRLAEAIHRAAFTVGSSQANDIARRLLEQGVTLPPPPPDPAVVVARQVFFATFSHWPVDDGPCDPLHTTAGERILDAVRDLFTPEALQAAAAKVQEAKR